MIGQLWRFAGVGVIVTLTHVLVAMLAEGFFHLPAQAANFSGFCVAVSLSYFGHAFITFGATGDHTLQVPRFILVALAGLVISSAITFLVHTKLHGSFALAMGVVAVVVPPVTFMISKYWVFNGRHQSFVGSAGPLVSIGIAVAFLATFWGRYLNHDVAWYLVATRKWLDGDALPYIDLIEVNPPLNFYLTIPAILISDALNISDTNAQYVFVAGLLVVSLTWVWSLLGRHQGFSKPRRLIVLGFVSLAILLPAAADIAQREHLMLLFILPYVFGYLVLPEPDKGRGAVARAGFAAIGLCIKPHFMLYPIALALLMIWRRKSLWPILSPANLTIVFAGMVYVALVVVLHPEYLNDIVPMALHVYGAYGFGTGFVILAIKPLALLLFVLMWVLLLIGSGKVQGVGVLFAVVAAAVGSYLLQWTAYPYQAVPIQSFIAITGIWILAQPKFPIPLGLSALAASMLVFINSIGTGFPKNQDYEVLSQALGVQDRDFGLMVFSTALPPGFPLALETHADWISRYPALWLIPGAVNGLLDIDCAVETGRCEKLREILAQTRTDIVSDFEKGDPDVLIFDHRMRYIRDRKFNYQQFLSDDPRYDALMSNYVRKLGSLTFTYMVRRPPE